MKQYLLSIYQPDGPTPPADALAIVMQKVNAIIDDAKAKNVWVFNGSLHPPSTATVVRHQGGERLMTDGPFAECKEHIGGFMVIKVADLDAALQWGGRLAEALTLPSLPGMPSLPIEVRPFHGEVNG